MKRLICLTLMIKGMTYGIAQNSEPKYFEKEVEVTDTAKAIPIAEKRRRKRTIIIHCLL